MKIEFQSEKQKNAIQNDGFNIIYGPAKRIAFKVQWYLIVFLILSPLVIFGWHIMDDKILVQAEGILTTQPIVIKAPQSAFVKKVIVKEGDSAKQNDVLVELASPVVERQYTLLEKRYKSYNEWHEKGLRNLEHLYNEQLLALKENGRETRKMNDKFKDFQKRGTLQLNEQLLMQQADIQSTNQYQQALIGYEAALSQYRNGPLAKTGLDIEVALEASRAKRDMLYLSAPTAGKVNEILVKSGEFIKEGDPIMTLSNLIQPIITVYLKPTRMDYAKVGQTATITFPNGKDYLGIVDRPVQVTQKLPATLTESFQASKAMIKVTLEIDSALEDMVEGLPVKVRFHYDNENKLKDLIASKSKRLSLF